MVYNINLLLIINRSVSYILDVLDMVSKKKFNEQLTGEQLTGWIGSRSVFRNLKRGNQGYVSGVHFQECSNVSTRNTLDCDQSNYSSRIAFFDIPIEFGQKGISAIRSADPENPIPEPNME